MKTPLIVLVASCIGGLLAWGICGSSHSDDQAMLGLGVLGLSAVGSVIGIIWLLVAAIRGDRK